MSQMLNGLAELANEANKTSESIVTDEMVPDQDIKSILNELSDIDPAMPSTMKQLKQEIERLKVTNLSGDAAAFFGEAQVKLENRTRSVRLCRLPVA